MKKIVSIICALTLVTGVFAQKLDRSKRPVAGAAPEIKLGKIESFTLANGLKVFVVENHKLPKVAYSLTLDVDPVMEGDMAGYISTTGELLGRGTTNRTKQKIDEEIDFIGATLSTRAGGAYGSSLKKHQDKLLAIMSDVIMNAKFTQEELDKIKKQTISGLASAKDNPDAIATNVKSVLLYGNKHPYGEITTGKTVEKITLEKCKEYYTTYFRPNVSYMAVVGDITVEEAKKNVEKYFGSWEKGDVPTHKYRTPQAPAKTTVAFVHKEGSTQSVINITYPINLKHNSPDVIKAKIMNSILGGSATARLFMNLREGHGFTYGAYSRIRASQLVGNFNANAKVRNEVTDSSLVEFMVELNRIVNEKVTEEDLQNVKNYMTGTFAYSLQDPQTIARFAINTERYNLSADYYATYLKQVAAVTVDDIQAMAKKYIKPENALILIIGDKEVADKAAPFSADKKVSFYDNGGNDYVEALKAAPEGMTAEKILDKAIVAKYGLPVGKALDKKLKKIKDVTIKMDASMQGQTINFTRYAKAPNKFALAITMGAMVIQKQTFDGTEGKTTGMQGNKDIEGDELAELKENSVMFSDIKYATSSNKYALLGVEPINDKDAYKIEVTNTAGDKSSEWYDVATGMQVKAMKISEMPEEAGGGTMTSTTMYYDYKMVNGINYAHKINQASGPQVFDMNVTSVEHNTKLGDDVFEQ
ncbi:MAG: insulinase family protein [Flavobacteriales bacterium]|nr:insulinase family protein [Flavobacteriales bacterium]